MTENPWIEWAGGECPVEPGVAVEILYRWEREPPENYVEGVLPASEVDWAYDEHEDVFDVVAYRIAP